MCDFWLHLSNMWGRERGQERGRERERNEGAYWVETGSLSSPHSDKFTSIYANIKS